MRFLVRATHVAAFTSFARTTFKARKTALFMFSVAVLLGSGAAAVRGQSALDGFDPNANGPVYIVVVQPDGKILIGGSFTTVLGVARNNMARLNTDGTLDAAFDPNANGDLRAIAVQADGKILAGGAFRGANSIGGQMRNYIARLDATTGLADSFDPNANGDLRSIVVQADGKILVGGDFGTIGGHGRNFIARLDATTGLADSFNPNANGNVLSMAVQADGKVLAGGGFMSIGGQTRVRIARLDATSGLADSFDPNANDLVYSIALQADGKILAGGLFTNIGGQTRNFIARLDATTGLADSFDPNANSFVLAIAVQADGKILAGGFFTASIGGQPRLHLARLDATTGLADSFDPKANSDVWSIAVQADGKILAGGVFTALAPNGGAVVTRNHIARLETDGRLDQTLDLGTTFGPYVIATAVQPDGKILIGGGFTSVLGVERNKIARLNTDGTLDTAFNPNAGVDRNVYSIAVQADGKILVGGDFTGIGGQTRNYIARLDGTTGLADSFDPNANENVYAIAVQADGKILAAGSFTRIGGQTRHYIARLDPTTGLADSFNPNARGNPGDVYAIALQADGKILAGGLFNSIGGQPRNRIGRLNATTGLADSFNPNALGNPFNTRVEAIAIQADGKILAGGWFTGIGGQPRNYIARLDAMSGLADSFDPNANSVVESITVQADGKVFAGGGFNTIGGQTRNYIARLDPGTGLADSFDPNAIGRDVYSIALQADGKILVGGFFTTMGGQPRSLFARLSNDTAALQNLAVSQTTITWARSGSSLQFPRVTFEYSNDSVNYIPLGNGTAAGSNWTLTSLNLPTEQSFYIRARGYYRSGQQTGSESITESVRNAFLAVPTPTPTPSGTPTPTPSATPTPTPCQTPAAPTNLGATAISCSQIDLTWTDNANNETGFRFQRSLDGINFAFIPGVLPPNTTTSTVSGLTPGTTYYFRVGAFNSCGFSNNLTAASATTPSGPAAPTNLGATAISSSQIGLSWTDNANNETGFRIQRSTDGINFAFIVTLGANVTAYTDNGRTPGTIYYYRVGALNACGFSAPSNVASATTPP